MGALYITSNTGAAGKTTIAAAIGQLLAGDGKKAAYLKVGSGEAAAADAAFMKDILKLDGAVDTLTAAPADVKKAYDAAAKGRDTVIIEGLPGTEKASAEIAAAVDAKVVFVDAYAADMSLVELAAGYNSFGKRLAGVIFNNVPAGKLEAIKADVSAGLGKAGIKTLGFMPEDRTLCSLSVAELAEGLGGKILNNADRAAALVSNFMLGIIGLDRNPVYFQRQAAKAVLLPAQRGALAMAALDTDTACLVLTGGGEAHDTVKEMAAAKKVPLIQAPAETEAVIAAVEKMLAESRFHQAEKLPRLTELAGQNLEISAL